ncbi:hypothetical protein ACFY4B_03195 [Kitasatospora sp. NPDC001261]|uniref:hypothetical protein n=1 Tax=Kitasatospora sp. NPDC001261 TaxID=3364012 RepID=UPI003688FD47
MAAVIVWTGLEARALRLACRKSVRDWAAQLGMSVRAVSNWEKLGVSTRPRPDTQAIFDTVLRQCDPDARMRFEALVAQQVGAPVLAEIQAGPRAWEYESWAEDIERAVLAASRQEFASAGVLLERWRSRWPTVELDDRGLYLLARSTALVGDLRRDQGALLGPLSASASYAKARLLYTQLDIPRRTAQLDLALAVVTEMSGQLSAAADRYSDLSGDVRLSARDRTRAALWVGTSLDKQGSHEQAIGIAESAIRAFENLGEVEDWATGNQKLALAYRGAGNLREAVRLIEVARTNTNGSAPMQDVRLTTAHGHILLTDRATAGEGLALLERAEVMADKYGMTHQRRSIRGIRSGFQRERCLQ